MAVEFSRIDKLSWRRFMLTDSGKNGMLFLRERTPSIGKGAEHEIVFDAGVAQGYKNCLDSISNLLAVEEQKEIKIEND